MNNKGCPWVTRPYPDPYRNLLAAIVTRAVHDLKYDARRADALAYLHGRNFEADAAWLDLDPHRVRRMLETNS